MSKFNFMSNKFIINNNVNLFYKAIILSMDIRMKLSNGMNNYNQFDEQMTT